MGKQQFGDSAFTQVMVLSHFAIFTCDKGTTKLKVLIQKKIIIGSHP